MYIMLLVVLVSPFARQLAYLLASCVPGLSVIVNITFSFHSPPNQPKEILLQKSKQLKVENGEKLYIIVAS